MKKHARQIAAWEDLLGYCNELGDSYNPSNDSIKNAGMQTLLNESVSHVDIVNKAKNFLANAITERLEAFEELPSIGGRVVRALASCGALAERVADVDVIRKRFSYQRNLKGEETTDVAPGGPVEPGTEDGASREPKKLNQVDFISRVDNLKLLIGQLEEGSPYTAQEEDISLAGLKQLLATLEQHNDTVAAAKRKLNVARTKLNELLYGIEGMHQMSQLVKKYAYSAYGYKDKRFKTINKIKFMK